MSEEIEPALSAEEWAEELDPRRIKAFPNRHRIAAVALYGQPFGFTAEDVVAIRILTDEMESHDERDVDPEASHDLIDFATLPFGTKARLVSLASRIAALLPQTS